MEAITWYMSLIIGTVIFLIGVVYLLSQKIRSRSDFIKATAIELLASWVLWMPYEIYEEVTVDNYFLHLFESILTGVMRTLNVFSIEEYKKLVYPGSEMLTSGYAIVRVLVSIAVSLFAFGWIMSFFDGPIQKLKLFLRRRAPTCVFPEFNEKTASIAKSIYTDDTLDANIVFLAGDEVTDSDKNDIEKMGGVILNLSLPKMIRQLHKHTGGIEVYLFGKSDVDNLQQLEEAFDEGNVDECGKIHFYVELRKTPWALCDNYVARKRKEKRAAADGESPEEKYGEVLVNFVRTEENTIYHTLWRRSFLNHVNTERDGMKKAEVLLLGMNDRSIEMFRTVLQLTQMPGYAISLTVLDEGENLGRLQAQMPGLVFNEPYRRWGDAVYSITYHENVDLDELSSESKIDALSSFTYAYVNAGDDIRNITLAMRLQEIRQRAILTTSSESGFAIMVDSAHLSKKNWTPGTLQNIDFSGNFGEVYSRRFITMSTFEDASIAVHDQRQKDKANREIEEGKKAKYTPWTKYCNSEYNRRSVYARTLSLRYKLRLLREMYGEQAEEKLKSEEWLIAEHMRWDMYTRTIGYLNPDETMRELYRQAMEKDGKDGAKAIRAKTHVHEDLVSYEMLPESEKNGNDEITITEEVRKQLEKDMDEFERKTK